VQQVPHQRWLTPQAGLVVVQQGSNTIFTLHPIQVAAVAACSAALQQEQHPGQLLHLHSWPSLRQQLQQQQG
jgi:hypothetical protein